MEELGLRSTLEQHLSDDGLIKGWEATRRTCNGRQRAPLRKAARETRAAATASVLAGRGSAAARRAYLACVGTLHRELRAAGEQDFDGMLREALGWLEAQETGALQQRLPQAVGPLGAEEAAALERLRDYRFTNCPGHIGHAIDRDLRHATELAKRVREALAALGAATPGAIRAEATAAYAAAADRLRAELKSAGEPDFDGLLRQAVLVLDAAVPGEPPRERIVEVAEAVMGDAASGGGGSGRGRSGGGGSYGAGKGGEKARRWRAKAVAPPPEASQGA